eukprot:scaffold493_cov164-Pinguiococcus_pyrenoidosus.AAC.1
MAELRRLVLVDQRHLRAVDHRQSLTQLLVWTGCIAKAHALDAHIRRAERDQRWAAGASTHVSQETIDGPDLPNVDVQVGARVCRRDRCLAMT